MSPAIEEVVPYFGPTHMFGKDVVTVRNTVATEEGPTSESGCRWLRCDAISTEHVGLRRRSMREPRDNEIWGKCRLANKLGHLQIVDISTTEITLIRIDNEGCQIGNIACFLARKRAIVAG